MSSGVGVVSLSVGTATLAHTERTKTATLAWMGNKPRTDCMIFKR